MISAVGREGGQDTEQLSGRGSAGEHGGELVSGRAPRSGSSGQLRRLAAALADDAGAWLATICLNAARDERRRHTRRSAIVSDRPVPDLL